MDEDSKSAGIETEAKFVSCQCQCRDKRCFYFLMPMLDEEHLMVFSAMGFDIIVVYMCEC